MASATPSSDTNEYESCVLCLSKHSRTRPSFCQCKHCSIPLCLDCMKEHHDELLQDVAHIPHQYNELQQLSQTKQVMISDETAKSIESVNRYFNIYIDELRDTQRKIIVNLETEKRNAQDHVRKLDSDLRSYGDEIQGLAKESIVQMAKMKNLSTELKKIEQQLSTYEVRRTENLIRTQPEFSIKFDSSPADTKTPHSNDMKINEASQPNSEEPSSKNDTLNIRHQPFFVVEDYLMNQRGENIQFHVEDDNSGISDDDDADTQDGHIDASYNIERMASDGKNILYTSYFDDEPDLIAYCLVSDDNDAADKYREWNQSRIVDMIWWDSIKKFICATENGIYTVDYTNKRFKIVCVIREKWSYIRVGANSDELFVWMNPAENDFDGIEVYSTEFDHVRTIDFDTDGIGSFVSNSSSFCVTDNLIASICTRKQGNRDVFQVTFCDLDMNKIYSILLGCCDGYIEIRTDDKDQFFITTGRCRFYIVCCNGEKQTINLQNKGGCIAVLNHKRVAVSKQRDSIEILNY